MTADTMLREWRARKLFCVFFAVRVVSVGFVDPGALFIWDLVMPGLVIDLPR
jgi:hypothetical protein